MTQTNRQGRGGVYFGGWTDKLTFPVESTPSSLMYDVMGGGVRRLCGDGEEVVLINKCLWGSPRSLLPVTRPGGSCIWYEVWYIGVGISVLVFMYATF